MELSHVCLLNLTKYLLFNYQLIALLLIKLLNKKYIFQIFNNLLVNNQQLNKLNIYFNTNKLAYQINLVKT